MLYCLTTARLCRPHGTGRFTGWADVALNPAGRSEAAAIGELLAAAAPAPTRIFTSRLQRATETLDIVLSHLRDGLVPGAVPVPSRVAAWELNERHYGGLTGLLKSDVKQEFGVERLKQWRRGHSVRPPPMTPAHPFHRDIAAAHHDIPTSSVPAAESLADCERRCVGFLERRVLNRAGAPQPTLLVAHNNVIRGLVKHLSDLTAAEAAAFEVPTGGAVAYNIGANGAVVGPRVELAAGGSAAFRRQEARSLAAYGGGGGPREPVVAAAAAAAQVQHTHTHRPLKSSCKKGPHPRAPGAFIWSRDRRGKPRPES